MPSSVVTYVGRHDPPAVGTGGHREVIEGSLVAEPDQRRPGTRGVTRAEAPSPSTASTSSSAMTSPSTTA